MPRADDTVIGVIRQKSSHPPEGHTLPYRPVHTLECRVPGAKLEEIVARHKKLGDSSIIHSEGLALLGFPWPNGQATVDLMGPGLFLSAPLPFRTNQLDKFCASAFTAFKMQHISKAEKQCFNTFLFLHYKERISENNLNLPKL